MTLGEGFAALHRRSAQLAAAWGACAVVLSNMPIMDATAYGFAVKILLTFAGVVLIAANWRRVFDNLDGGEFAGLTLYGAMCFAASLNAVIGEQDFSFYQLVKLLFLNLVVFLVAKLLDSREAIQTYLRWFMAVVYLSCAQSLVSVFAAAGGMHTALTVTIASAGPTFADVKLAWLGLLGRSSSDMRSAFYFSEPAYYGQLLVVGLALAIASERRIRVAFVGMALASSIAIASWGGAAIALVMIFGRFGGWRQAIVIGVVGLIGAVAFVYVLAPNLSFIDHFVLGKFKEGGSGSDKSIAFLEVLNYIAQHPWGIGMTNLVALDETINAASSVVQLLLFFGLLTLPFLFGVSVVSAWQGLIRPSSKYSGTIWMGLIGAMIATGTAGPLLKYWMVFLLSALLTLRRIELGERRALPATAAMQPT